MVCDSLSLLFLLRRFWGILSCGPLAVFISHTEGLSLSVGQGGHLVFCFCAFWVLLCFGSLREGWDTGLLVHTGCFCLALGLRSSLLFAVCSLFGVYGWQLFPFSFCCFLCARLSVFFRWGLSEVFARWALCPIAGLPNPTCLRLRPPSVFGFFCDPNLFWASSRLESLCARGFDSFCCMSWFPRSGSRHAAFRHCLVAGVLGIN